ncbi:MAG: deoxycytidine triphosphate deaminase [Bacilli bacterium]|nr:deoxycytidine triphosphate deaminase [Bacilli bacterium]
MILNDKQIIELCEQGMITPFHKGSVNQLEGGAKAISFGVSSFGYDLQVGENFQIVKKGTTPIDPKRFDESMLENLEVISDGTGRYVLIPPNSFALAHSLEYWRIPDDVVTIAVAKSTYARCGIIPNVTPFEGLGRRCHPGNFQYDRPPGQSVCR